MRITPHVFEAFLMCPTKCWLRAAGEATTGNSYAEWIAARSDTYRAAGTKRLVAERREGDGALAPAAEILNAADWRLAVDVPTRASNIDTQIAAIERVPSASCGKAAQFIPVLFTWVNKVARHHKLLLAFDALALSETLGHNVIAGKIIHGDHCETVNVRLPVLTHETRKLVENTAALLSNPSPPDLVLRRHCAECEFQTRCRQKAVEKDDLSLLAGMTEKERKKYHSKGIFTVTQLSYTFRPRRRPKRLRDKREKYHHALKALAIREKKIHIVGSPELQIKGTPVYLDVEGLPDRDFYYLIGVRVGNGDTAMQHSLWADRVDDERTIWNDFLRILATVEEPVLIHYGSYETVFLRRMYRRYGGASADSATAVILESAVNLLSVIFAEIYFPVFSNGLKDIARFVGFNWTGTGSSGLHALTWRDSWERSHDTSAKGKLIHYNAQDCEALELVTAIVLRFAFGTKIERVDETIEASVVRVDSAKFPQRSKWRAFSSPISDFEHINEAAHWNYQRDRISIRSTRRKPTATNQRLRPKRSQRVEIVIAWERVRKCPTCSRSYRVREAARSITVHEILFGRNSLKRRLTRYVFQTYRCRGCGARFGMPERFRLSRTYGWNLIAYFCYHVIQLCIPQSVAVRCFNTLFGFDLHRSTVNNLKSKTAAYYRDTKQQILEHLVRGQLIHADETRANIKGRSAFVWVLTSLHEVVYLFADSREGEVVQKLLVEFKGVLVSDFYAAYDSIDCPQQKCLIHLIRDLNDEVLNNPFDEQLKQVVTSFGQLLRPIIETIDRFGLKRHFLNKHVTRVDCFYRKIEQADYQTEAASKCRDRLIRNRDKLFTFLKFDDVPWNNNNAEHAIKAFARVRDVVEGASTEKGTQEYLTLLSVCQTCKYMGVDFLDFLRSGEKDVYAFADSRRKRKPADPKAPPAIGLQSTRPPTTDKLACDEIHVLRSRAADTRSRQ